MKNTIFSCFLICCCFSMSPVSAQQNQILDFLAKWNNAHNTKEITMLSELYADHVFYYGTMLSKQSILKDKERFFQKTKDLEQYIIDEPLIWQLQNNIWKINFTKQVLINGKANEYPSFLIVEKKLESYKIIQEMDSITEQIIVKKMMSLPDFKSSKTNFQYEPIISKLSGTVITKRFYGPPNYGETPDKDELQSYYILIPNQPINMLSLNEGDGELNLEPIVWQVSEIQLSYDKTINLSQFKNKKVIVTGTFFKSISGGHHTQVLMNLNRVQLSH